MSKRSKAAEAATDADVGRQVVEALLDKLGLPLREQEAKVRADVEAEYQRREVARRNRNAAAGRCPECGRDGESK